MKSIAQHLLSLVIFLAIAFIATAVFAQEDTDTADTPSAEPTAEETDALPPNRETVREAVTERRTEMQENLEERREEVQQNITERRTALAKQIQERITNLAANLSNRLDAVTARLENIVNRLDARIAKLAERNIDTTAAAAELENAKAAIDAAKNALATIDTLVQNAVTSENPRADWATVKMTYLTVREHVKDAHESLRTTVALLKTAVMAAPDETGVDAAVSNENANSADTQ